MNILVFSDIHGSLPVVRRMLALVENQTPDAVILLGDILYHGPRNHLPEGYSPQETAEALAPLAPRVIAIAGNCDSEVDEALLPFPMARNFSWVLDGKLRIFAVHGHTIGPDRVPPLQKGDILLSGHTHVPTADTAPSGIHLCNPGSLALPKNGSPPCYGLFSNGVFQVFTETGNAHLRLDCRRRDCADS
jgi:putative phosphoesterase